MTNEEAKTALFNRTPVLFNNTEYLYISAIIYRYDKYNNLIVSAELTDKNKRSVTIAQIKDVKPHDKQNQATTFLH
jgi:hypothetical protein